MIDPFLSIDGKHSDSFVMEESGEDPDDFASLRGKDPLTVKNKRKAQPTHMPRAMKLLESMHPGCMLYVCEKRVTTYSGAIVKVDQWGFGDICGITAKGAWVMANVTTKANMGAHMREYTNPANVHGAGGLRVVDLLERYLALRGTFYIIGYSQPNGRLWVPEVWNVDQALIDEYRARKRR